MVDTLTPKIARSVLADVIEAAHEHVYQLQLVGIESRSAEDLEEALSRLPCLFCGVIAFSHDDDCPRYVFRPHIKYGVSQ